MDYATEKRVFIAFTVYIYNCNGFVTYILPIIEMFRRGYKPI